MNVDLGDIAALAAALFAGAMLVVAIISAAIASRSKKAAAESATQAKRSADAAETSAGAAERSATAEETQARLAQEAAEKYEPKWVIQRDTGDRYFALNHTGETAHDVSIEGVKVSSVVRSGPGQEVPSGGTFPFMYSAALGGSDFKIVIRWKRPEGKGGEEQEWPDYPPVGT